MYRLSVSCPSKQFQRLSCPSGTISGHHECPSLMGTWWCSTPPLLLCIVIPPLPDNLLNPIGICNYKQNTFTSIVIHPTASPVIRYYFPSCRWENWSSERSHDRASLMELVKVNLNCVPCSTVAQTCQLTSRVNVFLFLASVWFDLKEIHSVIIKEMF